MPIFPNLIELLCSFPASYPSLAVFFIGYEITWLVRNSEFNVFGN